MKRDAIKTKLIGILNVTTNSFSDGGMFYKLNSAINRFHELLEEGADLVDIGAQSTTYGAQEISQETEWEVLEPILNSIEKKDLVSVDTYKPFIAKKAIDAGVSIIHDVSGGSNPEMLDIISANPHVKYIAMVSLAVPADMNKKIHTLDALHQHLLHLKQKLLNSGIKKEQIILDPGISFAADIPVSFNTIANCEKLQNYGVPFMISHSRKSFFESVIKTRPEDRDVETVAASLYMFGKIDFLRIHNVKLHMRIKKIIDMLTDLEKASS